MRAEVETSGGHFPFGQTHWFGVTGGPRNDPRHGFLGPVGEPGGLQRLRADSDFWLPASGAWKTFRPRSSILESMQDR